MLIVSKIDIKLNKTPKIGYFCTKPPLEFITRDKAERRLVLSKEKQSFNI